MPLPGRCLAWAGLPEGSTPHLVAHALHTALAVTSVLPDGTRHVGVATIEEVTRPDTGPTRGLLLDFGTAVTLPAGTEIW